MILKQDNEKALFKYRDEDKKNYKDEQQQLVHEMEDYTVSNLQVFQYLMQNGTRFIE